MLRFLAILAGLTGFVGLLIWSLRSSALARPLTILPDPFFNSEFDIVAHRGGSLEAPENTLAAFRNAHQIGPDVFIELDVHYTNDKQIVVIHDPTVERTTDGVGRVQDMSLAELKALDAGHNFTNEKGEHTYRNKGIQIPTLKEVFEEFKDTQQKLIVEIKPDKEEMEDEVFKLIDDYELEKRIMLGTQNSPVATRLKKKHPKIRLCASRDEVLRGLVLLSAYLEPIGSWAGDAYLIPEKDIGLQVLTPRLRNELKRRGKKLLIWTVNDIDDMKRLKEFGVDGLITDRPSVAYALKSR